MCDKSILLLILDYFQRGNVAIFKSSDKSNLLTSFVPCPKNQWYQIIIVWACNPRRAKAINLHYRCYLSAYPSKDISAKSSWTSLHSIKRFYRLYNTTLLWVSPKFKNKYNLFDSYKLQEIIAQLIINNTALSELHHAICNMELFTFLMRYQMILRLNASSHSLIIVISTHFPPCNQNKEEMLRIAQWQMTLVNQPPHLLSSVTPEAFPTVTYFSGPCYRITRVM